MAKLKPRFFINHYGVGNQLKKLIEEMAELEQAILKNDYPNALEEMADVLNLLEQFEDYFIDDKIREIIEEKRQRQLERIKKEKKKK